MPALKTRPTSEGPGLPQRSQQSSGFSAAVAVERDDARQLLSRPLTIALANAHLGEEEAGVFKVWGFPSGDHALEVSFGLLETPRVELACRQIELRRRERRVDLERAV